MLARLAEGNHPWAIPWPCLSEFLAIVTHPRIYNPPTPLSDALAQIRCWVESPSLVLLNEGEGFYAVWEKTLGDAALVGGAIHDARVAALCIYHGAKQLLTSDRDFSRFPKLRVENPLLD